MSKDTRDALLLSAFFLGYALVLAFSNRVSTPRRVIEPINRNRLAFGRSQRERLIAEENGFSDGVIAGIKAFSNGD